MGFYSIWPVFACLTGFLALVSLPALRAADVPSATSRGNRLATIDGLRGFLALSVFLHHGAIYHQYIIDGSWTSPASPAFVMLGQGGVATFFMITGFLFWTKLIENKGRPDWGKLYIGRLCRIGPMYLFVVCLAIVGVIARLGLNVDIDSTALAREGIVALLLGLIPVVTGGAVWHLLAGVTWSLQYEWLFYLSLPILALACRRPGVHLMFSGGALAAAIAYLSIAGSSTVNILAMFLVGMLCASLQQHGVKVKAPEWALSSAVCIIVTFAFAYLDTAYTGAAVVLLGIGFFLVSSGSTVFGLLMWRPAGRLGDISYGIYLMQGLVLATAFRATFIRDVAAMSPGWHWFVIYTAGCVLVIAAALTHKLVEQSGIRAGRTLTTRLANHTPQSITLSRE